MISVAAYCRVSTDREDQSNSFQAQQRYFREYIKNRPDWQLYEIYADEGITGTSTGKRAQFNRMINDAYEGRFRIILTKEVSRFSRNILDTIRYTRELKAVGVGVIFAADRISTLEPESEMLLSFLASLAQEESRRTSSRVVWGQTRQMERGVVFGQSLLGYDVKDGILSVNPEGAEIVRLIFHKYAVEQVNTGEIARYLTEQGYRTNRGSTLWRANTLIKILKNEKYVGDLVQKKTYTPDFLTHEKKTNRGQVPFVILRDHHEPIVSREVWNLARERLQKNNKHGKEEVGHSSRYVFSGKIRCGECGSSFVCRYRYRKDGTKLRRWSCGTAAREGSAACGVGKLLRDDDALQMLLTAVSSLSADTKSIAEQVTDLAMEALQKGRAASDSPRQLSSVMDRIRLKKERVLDAFFSGMITKEDMQTMNRKYDLQLEDLTRRRKEAEDSLQEEPDPAELRGAVLREISGILAGKIQSEVFCRTLLDSLTVFQDRHMDLRLTGLPHVFRFLG